MIPYLPVMVAVFIAGVVVGRIGCKVRLDEKRDENVRLGTQVRYLHRQVAMWKAKTLITESALRESQGRHQQVLEENGHVES